MRVGDVLAIPSQQEIHAMHGGQRDVSRVSRRDTRNDLVAQQAFRELFRRRRAFKPAKSTQAREPGFAKTASPRCTSSSTGKDMKHSYRCR